MARRALAQLDRPLLAVLLTLCALGLYNLASASRPFGAELHVSQGMYMLVGLGLMVLVASIHYRNLEGLALPIFVACVVALLATDMFGKLVNGSRRWLVIGPVNVQTSDLAKLAVIVAVARMFHMERWDGGGLTLRHIFRPLNISRPLALMFVVILLSATGEVVRPPKLEQMGSNGRPRPVAKPSEKQPLVTVGSGKKADVRIQQSGVARRHAEVVWLSEGSYLLRDLGSEAGTFVNEQRIAGEVPLSHGDVIRFGLNPRAELRLSASIQKIRRLLPWLALLGTLWLAAAVARQFRAGKWSFEDVIAPIDVVIVPAVLILAQPDLGTAIVVVLIAFSMILFVGLRPLSLLLLGGSGLAFVALAWVGILKPYQKQRVMTFLDPTSDLAGAGYHQHQSLIAIGSGEMFGKGHGQGTQTHLSFLPEQQTDFIFSVWAEEQGFLGCMLVVGLFTAMILLCLRTAVRARDRFGALLAVGVTAMLFWHALVNMLMVTRFAPVVGVPLPLWSNGGSFVVTTLMGLGLVFNVGMRRNLF